MAYDSESEKKCFRPKNFPFIMLAASHFFLIFELQTIHLSLQLEY